MFYKLQKKIDINITKNDKKKYVVIKQPKKNFLTNNICVVLTKIITTLIK